MTKEDIVKKCYKKSIELLIRNSTKDGFLAATPKGKANNPIIHYNWIYGRDSSICAMGAVASNNKELIKTAKSSLVTLARHQTRQGQIPNSLSEKEKRTEYYYMSSVDATLWWLIALKFYHKYSGDKKLFEKLKLRIQKAIQWLQYQTGGVSNLIEQAEASDWADIMPRSGHVLYSNILWYWAQRLYRLKGVKLTKSGLNTLFYPFSKKINSLFYKKNFFYHHLQDDLVKKIKPTNFYLSYIQIFSAGRHCDVYGNILALLLGLPDKKLKNRIFNYLISQKVSKIYPAQVLTPPILKKEREWNEVMERRGMNKSYQYHNGGIWPYIGGFWVMMLYRLNKKKSAIRELKKLALANKVNNWQFNEWFHGKTGQPMGMPGQSWNAGTFLLAYHYLRKNFEL